MPPEAAITMGMILGVVGVLLVQAFGRRKARQALAAVDPEVQLKLRQRDRDHEQRISQIDALQERLAVLERITIDPATRTAREIEHLRLHSN